VTIQRDTDIAQTGPEAGEGADEEQGHLFGRIREFGFGLEALIDKWKCYSQPTPTASGDVIRRN
jgi:hypothetical protein